METDRGDGRREDWQGSSYLRSGSGGGNHGDVHDRIGGLVRATGEYNARAVVGNCRYHGRESLRTAVVDGAEPGYGLGTDAAGFDDPGRIFVLGIQERFLGIVFASR